MSFSVYSRYAKPKKVSSHYRVFHKKRVPFILNPSWTLPSDFLWKGNVLLTKYDIAGFGTWQIWVILVCVVMSRRRRAARRPAISNFSLFENYSPFHKILPKSCLKMYWILVRFCKMGVTSKVENAYTTSRSITLHWRGNWVLRFVFPSYRE